MTVRTTTKASFTTVQHRTQLVVQQIRQTDSCVHFYAVEPPLTVQELRIKTGAVIRYDLKAKRKLTINKTIKTMNSDNEKKVIPNIDEGKMMDLMVDGVRKEGFNVDTETPAEQPEKEKPTAKEQSRAKRNNQADYESIFFREVKTTARHGKSVYIDPDHHKKLTRIVQVIGEDNITIYAYLSNLLEHHFHEFEQQITASFNEKNKPIF
ncbi:uncharacterized protein DUF3408 [Flavobacterium araucananum]|nr:DUF3408 domain-containing protein [Flavobacterium araucananum]PWJ89667.1 uncharacterized protein DUF3408 [Flavobacterium araucananum]